MDISQKVAELEREILKIKTSQKTGADSGLVYRLDCNMDSYISKTETHTWIIEVEPMYTGNLDNLLVQPVGRSNAPHTLLVVNWNVIPLTNNKLACMLVLMGSDNWPNQPNIQSFGSCVSWFSNVPLKLKGITQLE